jgi:AbrB family looped-hinge helix DNA binding protein
MRKGQVAELVTISPNYRVVIPREIREEFNLKPGQKLAFIPYKGTLRVVIVPPIEEAYGMLNGMDFENLREEDDEER